MNCPQATRLLGAHADGELDLATSLAVEEHVEGCAACRRAQAGVLALRRAMARHATWPATPEALRTGLASGASSPALDRLGAWLRSPFVLAAPGVAALLLVGWLFVAGGAQDAAAGPRVVYHISDSATAAAALRTLGNHLQAVPGARVVVVAHNNGVDFLLAGARDEAGRSFDGVVREYRQRGVSFRICQNTLVRRGIERSQVIPEAEFVGSGIAEIGRLQHEEGFAYMRL